MLSKVKSHSVLPFISGGFLAVALCRYFMDNDIAAYSIAFIIGGVWISLFKGAFVLFYKLINKNQFIYAFKQAYNYAFFPKIIIGVFLFFYTQQILDGLLTTIFTLDFVLSIMLFFFIFHTLEKTYTMLGTFLITLSNALIIGSPFLFSMYVTWFATT